MKKVILILSIISSSLLGCSHDDSSNTKNNILGTWKPVEHYVSNGTVGNWHPIENGGIYIFDVEGNHSIQADSVFCIGTYQFISDNKIEVAQECTEHTYEITYHITFEDGHLILSPDPPIADEGSADKFQRID